MKTSDVEALLRQMPPEQAWTAARQSILQKDDGFDLHERVYEMCRDAAPSPDAPFPAWHPTEEMIAAANVSLAARQVGCADYAAFYQWSIQEREQYWKLAADRLGIVFRKRCDHVLEMRGPTRPIWFSGAQMNIVDSCFQADPQSVVIVFVDQCGETRTVTVGDLRRLVGRIAAALAASGVQPGEAIAMLLPMTPDALAIYLAIIAVGASVVAIAESFAPAEIAARLRITRTSLVFTQETMTRGGKPLALYAKLVNANAPRAILLPSPTDEAPLPRRAQDQNWEAFLTDHERFDPIARSPQDAISVLFSSGTTGEPKAIPWDQTTPIKCAADAHFHQDVHPGDVLCWPTSLGWMMGPWLLFAALINRATIALYDDAPTSSGFGQFVQDARVTLLGVVPSLVRAWRNARLMEAWDWSTIRAFSSTGECSNASDMLYLMFLANYKPVVEYCGGTEIGGAYITGTVVHPCAPATFTTPALGIELDLFGEDHQPHNPGEVFLRGPSVGLSCRLLNGDHDAAYFQDTPTSSSASPWRRHGDAVETLPGGHFRMLGRCDDSMNLGGIKVGCIEIEQVLDQVDGVLETAAVAMPPPGGGPARLVIYTVLRSEQQMAAYDLKPLMQQAIRRHLNPLFQIHDVRLVPALPRTASHKIIRRALRDSGEGLAP